MIFPKTALFMNLQESFSRLVCVFLSYGFNQAFRLNSMTFLNTNPSLNACLKFDMCITYSFLSC